MSTNPRQTGRDADLIRKRILHLWVNDDTMTMAAIASRVGVNPTMVGDVVRAAFARGEITRPPPVRQPKRQRGMLRAIRRIKEAVHGHSRVHP